MASTTNRVFDRLQGFLQGADLGHHLRIHRQPAGRVDDEHIVELPSRVFRGTGRDGDRRLVRGRTDKARAHLVRQGLQLLDGRRPVHIGADQGHLLALAFLEKVRKLGRRGGLARPLQPRHEHHGGRRRREIQRVIGAAHDIDQFLVDDLDEGFPRIERGRDDLSERPGAHLVGERLDHRQGDIRFEQRHADIPRRRGDGLLGQAGLAGKTAQGAAQAIGEAIEHSGFFRGT